MPTTDETFDGDDQEQAPGQPDGAAGPDGGGTEGDGQATVQLTPGQLNKLRADAAKAAEYEARFKGLQPVVQRHSEEAQRLRAEKARLEERLADFAISQLPEEERETASVKYRANQALQALEQERAYEKELTLTVLKEHAKTVLSTQYGVPKEKLDRFNDPNAMEDYARSYQELQQEFDAKTKTATRSTRATAGADRFEGGGAPVPTGKQPETMDEAKAAMVAYLRSRLQR